MTFCRSALIRRQHGQRHLNPIVMVAVANIGNMIAATDNITRKTNILCYGSRTTQVVCERINVLNAYWSDQNLGTIHSISPELTFQPQTNERVCDAYTTARRVFVSPWRQRLYKQTITSIYRHRKPRARSSIYDVDISITNHTTTLIIDLCEQLLEFKTRRVSCMRVHVRLALHIQYTMYRVTFAYQKLEKLV